MYLVFELAYQQLCSLSNGIREGGIDWVEDCWCYGFGETSQFLFSNSKIPS